MKHSNVSQNRQVGPWHFDLIKKELTHTDGHTVKLEEKIASLLDTLLSRRGEIVSKDVLIEEVWQGRELSEQTIPVAISKLRKALGDDINQPSMLATIPRQGYQLLNEVLESPEKNTPVPMSFIAGIVMIAGLVLFAFISTPPTETETNERIQYTNAQKPGVIVTINDVRTTDATADQIPLAIAVSEMSSFFLAQVPDLLVIRHWWNLDAPDPTGGIYTRYGDATPVYSLKGTLLDDQTEGKVVAFTLSDPKTDEVFWSGLHTVETGSEGLFQMFSSMVNRLPISSVAIAGAPDESVGYWRARYFMQLSNEGAARIAARELSDLMGAAPPSAVAQSSARALAARWRNSAEIAADIEALEQKFDSTLDEQAPSGGHLSLVDQAALALFTSGDTIRALDLLDAALDRAPGDHYALSLYGEAKFLDGKIAESIDAYKFAFRLAPYAKAYEARLHELEAMLQDK